MVKNRIIYRKIARGIILVLLFCAAASAGEEAPFRLILPEGLAGYAENRIAVEAPEAGTLQIKVMDEYETFRVMEEKIPYGNSEVIWDGLGWNEERLNRKRYTFLAELQGESGQFYSFTAQKELEPAHQALLFALPSADKLYLAEAGDWFVEFKMIQDGELRLDFYPESEDTPLFTLHRAFPGGRINSCSLTAFFGSSLLQAGVYRVTCSAGGSPEYDKTFRLEIREGARSRQVILPTGPVLPERGATDKEIWEMMRKPSVVVDIGPTSHQKVYTDPDNRSKVLGTLHGQTQSLEVFDIRGDWTRIGAWNHESADYMEGWVPTKVLKVEEPQGDYGLLLDKKDQTLTLYYQGQAVDTLLVSTGRMEKNQLYQETAAGSFLTDLHRADFSTNGLKYDFVIRYDGGNLLHQLPYAWGEGKKDYKAGEIYLGTKASHACVRIQAKPGEGGVNAYWLWTHLPYHTRVLILDDPEERAAERIVLEGRTPVLFSVEGTEDWTVAAEEISKPGEGEYAVLTFGGDAVIGGRESYYGMAEGMPEYLKQFGTEYPFDRLKTIFSADDWTSVNLECVLKDDALEEDQTKSWRFRGLMSYADTLPAASVEMVNIANNHTMDYGESGYASTLKALEGRAVYCGNENNLVAEIRGHLFGFGGCRETTYLNDPEVIERDIRKLRELGAEFVIYQCHWGTEYSENHNKLQEAMARRCARAGADLVIGHHPHVVQGIALIGEMPVVYSLGNLVFGGTLRLQNYDGLMVQAYFPLDGTTKVPTLKLIPVLSSSEAARRRNDYQPMEAQGEDRLRILRAIQKDTAFRLEDYALLP